MRTANLAIVFTDIVGYADRLSRQTYEQSQRMLRLHEALVLPVFRAYRGRRVKSIGGGRPPPLRGPPRPPPRPPPGAEPPPGGEQRGPPGGPGQGRGRGHRGGGPAG